MMIVRRSTLKRRIFVFIFLNENITVAWHLIFMHHDLIMNCSVYVETLSIIEILFHDLCHDFSLFFIVDWDWCLWEIIISLWRCHWMLRLLHEHDWTRSWIAIWCDKSEVQQKLILLSYILDDINQLCSLFKRICHQHRDTLDHLSKHLNDHAIYDKDWRNWCVDWSRRAGSEGWNRVSTRNSRPGPPRHEGR